jgi:hypothetical protein
MAQKMFVIMGNDYPAGICSTEAEAEKYIETKKSDTKDQAFHAPRIYWRHYDFWLDQEPPAEGEDGKPGVWIVERHTNPGDSHIVNCFPDGASARAEAKRMNADDGPGYNNVEAVFLPFGKIGGGL